MSGFVQMYSTVGVLVPICRRRMLLKICTASFLPSKSMRWRLRKRDKINPVLYISWLSWASTMSDCWSDSLPNSNCFMLVNCLDKSSWAFSCFLVSPPLSRVFKASFKFRTISAGDLVLLKRGIFDFCCQDSVSRACKRIDQRKMYLRSRKSLMITDL